MSAQVLSIKILLLVKLMKILLKFLKNVEL